MPHKIITVAQQKGGAGKSTIAANLAIAFEKKGKKVAIIDIDPQESLTEWYSIREDTFGEDNTGIEFVTVSGWRLHNEIEDLANNVDVIIIDSPPHTQTETKTAIRAADLVIIPVQPSPADIWATKDTIDIVTAERIPHRVVLNRVIPNTNILKDSEQKLPNLLDTRICNRVAFASAMLEGKSVLETDPISAAAKEAGSLADEVFSLIFPIKNKKTILREVAA